MRISDPDMAIFGDLSKMPAHEVLPLIGARRGVLAIRQPGRAINLQLEKRHLVNYFENDMRVDDVLTLRDRFGRMLESHAGDFEFLPNASPAPAHLHLPVDQLIASTLQGLVEREAAMALLPSAHTVMVATGLLDLHLPDDLQIYWERALPHLRLGASALQLAGCTGVTACQSRWHLHRLRLAGLVRVRRATEKTEFGLRLTEADAVAPLVATAIGSESEDLRNVRLAPPSHSILHRLLAGFAKLFG